MECSQYVSIDHFCLNIHLVYLFVSSFKGRREEEEGGREDGGVTEPDCQL